MRFTYGDYGVINKNQINSLFWIDNASIIIKEKDISFNAVMAND